MGAVSGWGARTTKFTDAVGFRALPVGDRNQGAYELFGQSALFWTSTETDNSAAWTHGVAANYTTGLKNSLYKGNGYAVRCIKN